MGPAGPGVPGAQLRTFRSRNEPPRRTGVSGCGGDGGGDKWPSLGQMGNEAVVLLLLEAAALSLPRRAFACWLMGLVGHRAGLLLAKLQQAVTILLEYGYLAGRPTGWLAGCPAGWLAAYLPGRMAGCLHG